MVQMANDADVLCGARMEERASFDRKIALPRRGAVDAQCPAPGLTTGAPAECGANARNTMTAHNQDIFEVTANAQAQGSQCVV